MIREITLIISYCGISCFIFALWIIYINNILLMKTNILLALLITLGVVSSCTNPTPSYTVTGSIPDTTFNGTTIYIHNRDNNRVIDSTTIENGSFSFIGKIDTAVLCFTQIGKGITRILCLRTAQSNWTWKDRTLRLAHRWMRYSQVTYRPETASTRYISQNPKR